MSDINDLPQGAGENDALKAKENFELRPHPTVPVFNVKATKSKLTRIRNAHGATSAIGYRCSNAMELLDTPSAPTHLVQRQMDDLARLRAGLQ